MVSPAVLKEAAKRFPWLANVTLYGCLFAGGDLAHQLIAQREHIDWKHTRNVAIVAITFQGNFNYFWLRALERRFPGKSAGMVFRKLLLDQSFASPLATSVFYTGVSFLEGKEDIFEDWREKFFNTWRFLNFALMPLHLRTAFMGCCAFLWAAFLCFSRQNGDGTATVARTKTSSKSDPPAEDKAALMTPDSLKGYRII
uniref:MPV17 mitochondrial membrane protein like n=1 Tax=Oryzias melastigma TaxID=30732 RepID=A0A3B3C4I6_ORYME